MTEAEFDEFCSQFTATSHVIQWGGASVWKVAGKVFAIGGWHDDNSCLAVTFKTSREAFEELSDIPGYRPAPYLASRGMSWIQQTDTAGELIEDLCDHIEESYRIVAAGLSKRRRTELGIEI